MPSLGADMESGKLLEWHVKPGDARPPRRHRRDSSTPARPRSTSRSSRTASIDELLVRRGETVPVGTRSLATARAAGQAAARARRPQAARRPPPRSPGTPQAAAAPDPRTRRSPGACRRLARAAFAASRRSQRRSGAARRRARRRPGARPRPPVAVGWTPSRSPRRRAPARGPRPPRCARRSPPRWRAPSARSRTTTSRPQIDMTAALDWLAAHNRGAAGRPSGCCPPCSAQGGRARVRAKCPQLNGYWIDGDHRAQPTPCTSASPSRCAGAA